MTITRRSLEKISEMNSVVNRLAVMTVLAVVMIVGSVSQSEAALADYWMTQDSGTTIATGIVTDFTTSECTNDITTIGKTTLALKGTVGSCAGRWDVTTLGALGAIYYNTPYATDTVITGQATGNLWYLRENAKDGNATFQLEVFYVMPGGTETSLGFSDVANVASGVKVDYDFDLSAVSGTAPATSKLGYRLIWTGGSSSNARVYFGAGQGNGGGDVGYITVDEVAGAICGATAPGDLGAVAASSTQVDLTWTYDGTNNNYYTVYRDGVQITTNIITGSYSDTTAAAGTTYAYTVRGYNTTDTCESADSNTANVTTPSCTETTQSSIIWNGTTTAAGDFAGASFVTLTDIGTPEYRVTEGSGGACDITTVDNYFIDTTNYTSIISNFSDPGDGSFVTGTTANANCTNGSPCAGGITYDVNFPAAGTWDLWLYLDGAATPGNHSLYYGLDGTTIGQVEPLAGWAWQDADRGGGTMTITVASGGAHTINLWTREFPTNVGGVYLTPNGSPTAPTASTTIPTSNAPTGGGTVVDPNNCSGEITLINWSSDPLTPTASTVLTNGNPYNLYVRGNDTECGTMYYGDPTVANTTADGIAQAFTWSSCTETATLALTPIADPITGDVTVVATGTASGIQVGTTPAPTNASGWVYSPAQDDNTTVVSFYATGTGTCGPLTASQLNVATNTMVAPTVASFIIPANVTDTAAPLDVPITTFNAVDNVAVTGYMITIDDAVAPAAGAAGWTVTAPTSVTVPGYASYTLYAWAKDAAGNVSLSASAPVTMSNCVETGTVTVSISPDPDPLEITGATIVTANLGGGASNGLVSWSRDAGAWTTWVASGSTYTPSSNAFGTIEFRAMADGSCGVGSPVNSAILPRNYDTRVDALEPILQVVTQNGLTAIRVVLSYHDDKNNTGTFLVEYKLASEPTIWTTAANMPTTDGGAGDADGTLNEDVVVNLTGLTGGETYDIRMTYMDATDGIIGTAVYNVQLNLIAWVDSPMLHNNLRFAGTTKHGGNWGKPGDYAGAIQCSTCHEKAPANGNVKRIKAAISFPDGSTMPGGATSTAVSLLTVEDGTSDFGDDSVAPRASSNRVCEACHTYDAAQSVGVKQHAADQSIISGHYDNSDCIKCHLHNAGFKADCTTCHANPPITAGGLDSSVGTGSTTAGKHDYHVNTKGYGCNTCHTGWENTGEMPKNGNINIGFNIVLGSTTDTTGGYDGRNTGGGYTAAGGTNVTTGNGLSCSAIYCHGTDSPAWTDAGTAVCGSCHGDTSGMPSTTAGDGDLSGATSGSQVGKHAEHVITAGLACSTCHKDLGFGTPDHVSGVVDIWFDTVLAGASATYDNVSNTCSNLSCHISKVWDTASVASCDMCHGYPPLTDGSANDLHVAGATPVDHAGANIGLKHSECNTCHGYSQANGATDNTGNGGDLYQVSFHRDGNIQMNGISAPNNSQSAEYDQTTWGCAKACHANDAPHQLSDSALTVQTYEFGSGSCTGCHDGSGAAGTATSISDASPHALGTTGLNCEDCHGSHGGGTIEIPNNPAVGINYTANGETGIALGAAGTAPGATEAEICWSCHAGAGVDGEFGPNNKANTGSMAYNYGQLNGSNGNVNWVGATWTSASFSYKTGTIQSTHSVNNAVAGPGVDAVGDIRCSYCHDVHDLNNATGDTLTGAPYLRGTWMGNPYLEDGAPRNTNTYAQLNVFGAVPRGGSAHNELGGYQIDQNNGNPTNGWTLSSSAGLCTLCHGSNVDTMNKFGTASTDWVGTNGHSNAVIGGSGSNAANIFSDTDRNPNGVTTGREPGNPSMAYMSSQDRGFGFRSVIGAESEGWELNPDMNHADRPYGFNSYDWGATVDAGTTDPNYHSFSCSKCHNPHASRLPRLMITNCLDTNHNTWDTKVGVDMLPTGNAIGGYAMGADNAGLPFSNATSAQNCHRRGDNSGNTPAGQYNNATGSGWNNVTPWKEF